MLYSFGRMRVLSRGKTKSAVGSAAYHSASDFTNEWDGVRHDYSRKKDVAETHIVLPESAPAELRDESIDVRERLQKLWNSVELHEQGTNAQLARANYLALQEEFTLEQNLECVNRFIEENCTSIGMGVTYSVHLKPGNPHADMMYLMREFDKDGNFKNKSQKQYLCRKDGEECWLSSGAFKRKKTQGWEKVYKYSDGSETLKLTPSEAEERPGFERKSKYPIDRKAEVNTWNNKDLTKKWRKSWEVILNDKFEELGMDCRVDCRSYKEQGRERIPTVHVGYGPEAAEREELNKEIGRYNEDLNQLGEIAKDCLRDSRSVIKNLEEEEQTPETLQDNVERMRYNFGVLRTLIESGLLNKRVKKYCETQLETLRTKFKKLVKNIKERLKITEVVRLDSAKVGLDAIIKNAMSRKQESDKNKSVGQEKKQGESKDDFVREIKPNPND